MKRLKSIYGKMLRIRSRIANGRPVLVLMYHRVDDDTESHLSHLTVSIDSFKKQLAHFSSHYSVLSLEDDWSAARKNGIVITFDDGYAQTIATVLPMLEQYNIPATFFVPTENIGSGREFWWDRLAADYNCCRDTFYLPPENVKISKTEYPYARISQILANFNNVERHDWLLQFEKANQLNFIDRSNYIELDLKALGELARHRLVSIALHTHTHPYLGNMSYEAQKQELELSIAKMKEIVPDYSNFLAVPYGSYNSDTIKVSEKLGIKGVLLANNSYSNKRNKESGKIHRILMPNIQGGKLKKYLQKFD